MVHKIRVLIVDDSALMRRVIKEILLTDDNLEVVGIAKDGEDAIEKVRLLNPDVVTMDINMPVMDGLTSMQYILEEFSEVAVLILSSLTQEGALKTFEALELGAFDYVSKPSGTVSSNLYIVGKEIIEKVKAAYKYIQKRNRRKRIMNNNYTAIGERSQRFYKKSDVNERNTVMSDNLSKVVVIGISTGGPSTLMEVLPKIPRNLKASIIVVQHMPPSFTNQFARRIDSATEINFKEAEAGDIITDGRGFLAPGGYQLLVRSSSIKGGNLIRLTKQPQTLFMPSVNITMESVLECFGPKRTIGVLMTGMGDDGADAMVKIKKAGGITIAEDESTAIVYGMPREAIERGGADIVVPSHNIAREIIKAVNMRK
ncbi:chemotaxis response regulator protein-glutamate methylesterase [Clostridium sp. MF28]|uniref:protein-glutamate methylesterase/protein-glutamine glutaminase n=1 Tax=Clostridium TaxID=1485 RepID=UPI000CF8AA89|nr:MULTISPECIES: chemotaxis response regulator protein-glutamate methylesterase [Clostridium]AVK48199.1 chemotaxis response regulator protein-glutamate methylesterase [Clostridium sp. MF28]PSM58424.1 chemotaxis response regulator protein-glutamate methylesterase [Clostridium diolis]